MTVAFQNKTYDTVAEGINDARRKVDYAFREGTASHAAAMAAVETVAETTADALAAHHRGNYSFKRDRFMKACGF